MRTRASTVFAAPLSAALALSLCVPSLGAQLGGTTLQPDTRGEGVSRVGTRGANFLEIGVGARALALAGTYAAASNDLSALYWNVAGLADVQSATVMVSHEQLYGSSGLRNNYIAAGLPIFGGAFGVSFQSFTSGDVERTTEAYPDGGDPSQGNFVTWTASAVGLHYARTFTDRLSAGIGLKYASEGVQFARAKYYGADLGVRFRSGLYGTTLGASIANLGSTGKMDGPAIRRAISPRRDPLLPTQRTIDAELRPIPTQMPTLWRIGAQTEVFGGAEALLPNMASRMHRLLLLADVTDAVDTEIMPALAAEYSLRNLLFLRLGRRFQRDALPSGVSTAGITAGAGLAIPIGTRRFNVDYAFRDFGELQSNHAFSFQFGF